MLKWINDHKTKCDGDDYAPTKCINSDGRIVARVRNIYVKDEFLLLDEHYDYMGTFDTAEAAQKYFAGRYPSLYGTTE